MHAIVKRLSGHRRWPALLLLLCVIPGITACGRFAKPPLAVPRTPTPMPPPPAPLPPAVQPTLPEIQFTIQVGAFSTSERASSYADHLQTAGLDAYYFVDRDDLYKVRLERFDTREAALERALELQAGALIDTFFIIHPQPDSTLMDMQMALRESIVRTARRFIGTAYRWGGTSPREGFDCSGLTMTVYRLNGLELPRSARDQFRAGTPVAHEALQAGDLVFFATGSTSRISHVGIYSGQGQFIHAPSRGNSIRSASLANTYFASRYKGARRYF
jgi:hypothetical protein